MLYMNEYDIESARNYCTGIVLGNALTTLVNLRDWTDENSDGWAYWPKPVRAAKRLMELIQNAHPWKAGRHEPTEAEYQAAVRPIKAFRTRHNADFEIL